MLLCAAGSLPKQTSKQVLLLEDFGTQVVFVLAMLTCIQASEGLLASPDTTKLQRVLEWNQRSIELSKG